jgi:hypothetical protein
MPLKTSAPEIDCYAYVRRYYGVAAYVGMRVKLRDGRQGVLVNVRGGGDQYVHVRIDGERHPSICHPTDGVEYLVEGRPAGV